MEILRGRLKGMRWEECPRSKGRCADFFVEEEERRFWPPYLSVQVEPAETGSILRGRYGPHPGIWTLFVFLYTAVGFLTLMGFLVGFVQWRSGLDPWGFWGTIIGLPGLGFLYGISATGQRLSAHQIRELRDRLDALVERLEA